MYQYQVSFSDAVRRALTVNYCNFEGRSSRSEYWWYCLFTFIIGCVFTILGLIAGPGSTAFNVVQAVSWVVNLALILPGLGLCVRRLHDTGRSAWNLLWLLLPIVGAIILIVFFVQDSTPSANQYGPVPNVAE